MRMDNLGGVLATMLAMCMFVAFIAGIVVAMIFL